MKIVHVLILVSIATLVGVVLTILSGMPPLSILRDWVYENDGRKIWHLAQVGIITLCCSFYIRHIQKQKEHAPEEGQNAE